MEIRLEKVKYMPQHLEFGVLYVSYEYETAAHLCICGCGAKIRTPLGPTEWEIEEDKEGPSLWPSVGNWQQNCKSHYVIRNGKVIWADRWSDKKIEAGRRREQLNRERYYTELEVKRAETKEAHSDIEASLTQESIFDKITRWIRNILS